MGDEVLLCPPHEKAEREAANGVDQIDFLTDLVVHRRQKELRESHVLALQAMAVQGIYPCGGTYRDARTTISIEGSPHRPPEAALVTLLVRELVDTVNRDAGTVATFDRAAYVLWRLNWIHPFRGGNGRTSRAVAYQIICMDLGAMVPGTPSLPTLILENRHAYLEALRSVDASVRSHPDKDPDLTAMKGYVQELVIRQMASAVHGLALPKP